MHLDPLAEGGPVLTHDGDYTWTGPVTVAGPHRVWSDTLHGATIRFGLTYAGNADRTGGLELHGLDFLLDNASMAPARVGSTHVPYTWGQGGEDVCLRSTNRTESIDCYLQDGVSCVAHHHNGGATAAPPTGWPATPNDDLQPGGPWNRSNAALPGSGSGSGSGSSGQADSSRSS